MFFVLSKILLFLLAPFWWIVFLFVWSLLSKSDKTRKRLRITILVVVFIFTNPFIYRSLVLLWQPAPAVLPVGKQYGAGILLGGMAGYDKNNTGHFGGSADRFIQAANLYHRGVIKKIMISGGTGSLMQNEPAEAFFLRASFIENGIPDSAILIESRSRNTYENAVYSKKIIDSLRIATPFVVITSAMHMPRSASVFKKAGYDFITFPCDYRVMPQKFSIDTHILPNPGLLSEWSSFMKELVGLAVYKLTGKA